MLLEFSIDNFRCYKEDITFDFANNISAIFGANSSGKTNMLRCLFYSIKMIKENMGINKSPVLFQPNDKKKPVSIKIKFSDVENNIFLYELSVDNKSIIAEKYTALKFKDKENLIIFQKNFNEISISNIFKNKDLIDVFIKQIKLNNNTFSSFLFSIKIGLHDTINALFNFVEQINIIINEDLKEFKDEDLLNHIRKDNGIKNEILKLSKLADPTITDLSISNKNEILCHHNNEKRKFIDESSGTRKTILMSSIFIHAKKEPLIILMDEIDTHFHPLILSFWLEEMNKIDGNNQIIFVGHNPLVIDFLIEWKVLKDLNNLSYLYKEKDGIIKVEKGDSFYRDKEDKDKRFSELLFHNWMSYSTENLVL